MITNLGFLIYFYLVKHYDLSSVGPLIQSKLLFAIPLAFIFLNEFYGYQSLILMLLIFAGAVLSTYSKEFSIKALLLNNKLLSLAMIMGFSWALGDLPVKMLAGEISGPAFMTWRYIFSIPAAALFAFFLFKEKTRKAFSKDLKQTLPLAVIATLIGFTGIIFLFIAYQISYTISSALVLSQAIFVFVLAFILSKIKSSLLAESQPLRVYAVRLVGVILIISSIYFLMNGNTVL